MPYPSPADERGNGGCLVAFAAILLLVLVGVVSALLGLTPDEPTEAHGEEMATVYDTPADDGDVTVLPQSEGPIYDLPEGVESRIVCDRSNRAYILLTTDEGGVAMIPYLEDDGSQVVIPYG